MGCCGSSKESKKDKDIQGSKLGPIDKLKIRLANGEVTIDEYLQTKTVLEQ